MENIISKFNLKDGTFIRYKKIGKGSPLLLLHTIRNRLEYSDNIVPLLKKKFTIYSIDLPGFGESSINSKATYDQTLFTDCVVDFIEKKKLSELTLAGESIGGVLPFSISKKIPKKIKKIFSFNPYDYDKKFGDGIGRGNFFARVIMFHVGLPILGNFFARLENKIVLKNIFNGGFVDKNKLSENYLNLLCKSYKHPGYYYHFRNVLSNYQSWVNTKNIYPEINLPIELIYGDNDWSNDTERNETKNLLGLANYKTIKNCGHFSFLEQPYQVAKIILN